MSAVTISRAALEAAAQALSGKGPVHMVNLLRFRAQADYGDTSEQYPPCSGREAYHTRYAPAFDKLAKGAGVRLSWFGTIHATLTATEGEAWDDLLIVEYASFETLLRIIDTKAYRTEADPHRRAAVADWRFMASIKGRT